MLVLGHVPTKAELLLRKGCDFTWELVVDADELLPDGIEVILYVYTRDSSELIGFWPALITPGEIIEGTPASQEEVIVAGNPTVVTIPATPDRMVPDMAQLQIYADDHEIIPDGAKFTVVLKVPGFPKTAWLEGRVAKANR